MADSRYLLESGKPKADYAIIGEPTAMQPIYAHKGVSMISVQIGAAVTPQIELGPQCSGDDAPGWCVDAVSR